MLTTATSGCPESDKKASATELFVLCNHLENCDYLKSQGGRTWRFFQRAYRHHRCGGVFVTLDNRKSVDGFKTSAENVHKWPLLQRKMIVDQESQKAYRRQTTLPGTVLVCL